MTTRNNKDSAKIKTEWNLDLILSSNDRENVAEFRKKIDARIDAFVFKWEKDKSYLTKISSLKSALDEFASLHENYGAHFREADYWYLSQSLDLNNTEIKAKAKIARDVMSQAENKLLFFEHNLSKSSKNFQKKALEDKSLKEYHHYLKRQFESGKYLLSEKEEKLINKISQFASYNWVTMTSGAIAKEEALVFDENRKKTKKSFSQIIELTSNRDKTVRDTAARSVNRIFKKHLNIAENELNNVLSFNHTLGKERKVKRFDEIRHFSDDIDSKVVDQLVKSVTDNFQIAQRFYKLKAKALGFKKLHYHERNIEYLQTDKKYKYDEAFELVNKTLTKLDKSFSTIFSDFHKNGQVDVFPKKGKRSGAFCSYGLKSMPVFVMLNHDNSINNVLTLAHEFGHAIHFELSKKQNSLNMSIPMCTAETASTFFEDFALEEISQRLDKKEKIGILLSRIGDDVSTIFRQIAFYNFEFELHKEIDLQGYLSHEQIGQIFQKHMKTYMGEYVIQDPGSQNWWVYISHFRSPFYVYSYAFGLIVSKYLQKIVREDKKNIEKIKNFLLMGSLFSPKELFTQIGVDISDENFWTSGIKEIEKRLDELEELVA